MQHELEIAVTALRRGDWAPFWDFTARYQGVIIGVLVPVVLIFRFPGLIVAALRGLVVGGLFLLRIPAFRTLILRWVWRAMVNRSRRGPR
mmetsp:Transcript_17453/g.53439  ORF Transcript_17453/g.53439 Transcript_17453/m.53439 type:complete len:90 (+) Transcript_17453:511-780(+)